MTTTIRDIDLSNADFFVRGDPHAAWTAIRNEDPLHWNEPAEHMWVPLGHTLPWPGHWNITKYEDVFTISRDPASFISGPGIALAPDFPETERPVVDMRGRMMITSDPPIHTKLRQLVNKGFTPRATRQLETHVREITRSILDDLGDRTEVDFVIDISAKLPLAVICELMGVPKDDWQLMFDMTNRAIGSGDPEYQVEGEELTPQDRLLAFGYFSDMINKRREGRFDDLVQLLVDSEIDAQKLEDIDILLFCFLLIVAGNETTRNATSGGALALAQRPEQLAQLAGDLSKVPVAVEEILRWTSPVMHMMRTATRDYELRGKTIKEGQRVLLWYASANRDEDVFPDPHTFDITRTPNEHLAFGVGEHFCLGANLARMELQIMFEELLQRYPKLELAGEPERLRSNFIGGIKHMPMKLGR